ncbi:MAG: cytidine deaminase [Ruminiclostridium sp.]|nr:cytidine deaminase [Ruminiclostridium sp.]
MDKINAAELMSAAVKARESAYAPYSGFKVGAALLCDDGSVYTGCNVENASYPCGICAERTAAAKAVSEGRKRFTVCAVTGSSAEKCTPCGICRQFLYEFAPDMTVLCGNKDGEYDEVKLSELLPRGFGASSME